MGTNTGIGIGIGIPFKNNALGGDRPYLPPELKARLIGVWDNYGKKNTDADRNIIKNKIPNAGGDLEILNSAYRLNSGFGGYSNDFQEYTYSENVVVKDNTNAIFNSRGKLLVPYSYLTKDIPSFKIKVSGLSNTYRFCYYYRDSNGVQHSVNMAKNGNYELPICYNVQSSSDGASCGFTNCGSDIVSVEILPEYEGAFVTDGVNDMIISQKTLQEMGVTKDFTIVSMIHQITLRGATAGALTNYIRQPIGYEYVRTHVANIGKTGIYGYVVYDVNHSSAKNSHIINTILGDKNDYSIHITGNLSQGKFSVQGYINGEDNIVETSRLAHYWTFALLGKATEDDINLIIGYFNLDRTLKADIYCNIERQGITNDNHAEFNDKLIDYSGNGRDLQLFNIDWKGKSGVGRYTEEFKNDYWLVHRDQTGIIKDGNSIKVVGKLSNYYIVYHSRLKATNGFKVRIKGIKTEIIYNYISSDKEQSISFKEDGIYDIPASEAVDSTFTLGFYFRLDDINLDWIGLTIEIIPSNKGALCLDGINDFGKVINMPIYKDYTIIIDYIRTKININTESSSDACVLSKSELQSVGAFMFNLISGNREDVSYSFGHRNIVNINDTIRAIYYQSKYINNGQNIDIESTFVDSDKLWLGTFRDNDSRFLNGAIYFLMSFPYSMSEFLIERQLKKHKLGTLYPDMVEFRPVIKSNASYDSIVFYYKNEKVENGTYLTVGSSIGMHIRLSSSPVNEIKSITINGIPATFKFHDANNNIYQYDFNLTSKSPQKINITIDEYIRYEDIVQPYPSLFTLIDYDTEEVYSWGSKLKVGARFKGNVVNLLPNMYEWQGNVLYNGEVLDWGIKPGVVAKEMVFSWNMPFKYLIDNNEPKVILSPRLLRIPNSSYKILGHIPDISGHGNHGVIHNSAYAEGSGVNEDGSYQFDGVDDFVTIPTTVGGKQVLMKVNWDSPNDSILYDQRGYNNEFAIYNGTNDSDGNPIPAYQGRNNGQTYIDGILNSNIKASELRAITHNITITNELSSGANKTYPIIGSSKSNAYFVNMALYDFMLFDEISTEDKIKELNEYVGIEGNTE